MYVGTAWFDRGVVMLKDWKPLFRIHGCFVTVDGVIRAGKQDCGWNNRNGKSSDRSWSIFCLVLRVQKYGVRAYDRTPVLSYRTSKK